MSQYRKNIRAVVRHCCATDMHQTAVRELREVIARPQDRHHWSALEDRYETRSALYSAGRAFETASLSEVLALIS